MKKKQLFSSKVNHKAGLPKLVPFQTMYPLSHGRRHPAMQITQTDV